MKKFLLYTCLLAFSVPSVLAATPDEVAASLKARQLPVEEVRQSEIEGIYEVVIQGNQSIYVSQDGQHFLTGDMFRLSDQGFVNVSEEKRSHWRKELLDGLDESDMLVFSPPAGKVKATLNVFTDIDCGYCRKLHQEVPELNRLGIAVRYLAYPRAGVESVSYDKYVSAWCADNQQEAFTLAKLGEPITDKACDNPIAQQYALGAEMGVTGTPALLYQDGRLEMGYRNAATLAHLLGIN